MLRAIFCCCCKSSSVAIRNIDLTHNLLVEIPNAVYLCERTLEQLLLDSNHIDELPRQLFNCDELKLLSVSDNEISFVPPAISSLKNLLSLDLSKNAITTLPDNIRFCSSLIRIDLSINPLEKVPDGLVNLMPLQELYLTDVYLEFLPANFGKLVNLRILELRENNLVTLPKTMNRLIYLTRLDIGYNEFRELPEVVSSLQNLIELWIDGNHIRKISSSVGLLRRVSHFDASNNNLEHLPRDIGFWSRVTEFNISNNELISLPSTIGNMKSLVGLKLEDNCLKSLPESIGRLENLEELTLTHNYLTHLPTTIGYLRRLKYLTIDKNFLIDIPSEIGSCISLSILSLRGNRLSEIPAEIGHLSNLKVLNLVDNLIRFLPMSILKLEALGALWLSTNQSQPLVPLQQERDPDTNQTVLTCFMLPQLGVHHMPVPCRPPEDPQNSQPRHPARHICFAPSTAPPMEQPGRLTRAPTPYPKELRALAKHARHVQKTLSVTHHKPVKAKAGPSKEPLQIKKATVKVTSSTITTTIDSSSSFSLSSRTTPRSIDVLTEPQVSPLGEITEITDPTSEPSTSSLPVAQESIPLIREAKNIRTDTQTVSVHPVPLSINLSDQESSSGIDLPSEVPGLKLGESASVPLSPYFVPSPLLSQAVSLPMTVRMQSVAPARTLAPSPLVHTPVVASLPVSTHSSIKELKVPPPYHIAAAYSVKAQFFNQALTENASNEEQMASAFSQKMQMYNPTELPLPESSGATTSACSPELSSREVHEPTSNINETFIRTGLPLATLDNDNVTIGDHENNLDAEEHKPRFFIQDKPAPGENVVIPTPKRPSSEKGTRIPYLTSPTPRRSPGASTSNQESLSRSHTAGIASPRLYRRDTQSKETQADISFAIPLKKTKIPAPQQIPISPETARLKWVFGQHKNATVIQVLITKEADLGFSIIEVAGRGIFIDDVKDQPALSVGDKILEVEGIDVTCLNKEEVMEILLGSGKSISMMISHI